MTASAEKVINIPVWKKGCTAAEYLYQMAQYATDFPEEFETVMVVTRGDPKDKSLGCYTFGDASHTMKLGMLTVAQQIVFKQMESA